MELGIIETSTIKLPPLQNNESSWDLNRAEMVPWTYEQNYHNIKIKVVEVDHVKTRQLPDNINFPEKWRDMLENQITNGKGHLVLEYFIPELENTVYSNPILGGMARLKGEEEHVTPFFGYAAKICGREGKTVYSADPNTTPGSFILQRINLIGGYWIPFWLKGKSFDDIHQAYYGGLHVNNLQGLEKTFSIDDARRLYTARAVLSIAIKNAEAPEDVSLITAPVHAERISYYIDRQVKFEKTTGHIPQTAMELSTISPNNEAKKMKSYGILMRPTLREYKPVLPPSAFELDIEVNDHYRIGYAETSYQRGIFNLSHLNEIKIAIQKVLQDETNNAYIQKYRDKIKDITIPLVEKLIHNLNNNVELSQDDLGKLESSVSTHKIGWINVTNSHIY